jgi:hypothetical protein
MTLDTEQVDALIARVNAASERLELAVRTYQQTGTLVRPGTIQVYADGRLMQAVNVADVERASSALARFISTYARQQGIGDGD